jgi:hypothetical protein
VIRILFVGAIQEAHRLREFLESNGPAPVQVIPVASLDFAVKRISGDEADVLLLDLGSRLSHARANRRINRGGSRALPGIAVELIPPDWRYT